MLSSLGVWVYSELADGFFPFGVGEATSAGESSKRRDDVCSGEGVEAGDMDISMGDWAVRESCINSMFGGRACMVFIGGGTEVPIVVCSGVVVLSPSKALTWELLVACIGVIGV